jgi:Fur family ferric uptake transcriptional regulator
MQKEQIIEKLRESGCRITKQRMILLDIILEDECSCCKEIYYKASQKDHTIGAATVYRLVNTLEDIGAISRNAMYSVMYEEDCECRNACRIEYEDGSVLELSKSQWSRVVSTGLRECGYMKRNRRCSIVTKECE